MASILVIDDDRALCRSLELQLTEAGHDVACSYTAGEGIAALASLNPDIVFCDLRLPDGNGLDVLTEVLGAYPDCVVIMITGVQDTKATIEAVQRGAFDYIRKPLDLDAVLLALEKAHRQLVRSRRGTAAVPAGPGFGPREIVGADPKIIHAIKEIGLLSRSRVPVLIIGESGTGKELVARALHEAGSPGEPFVALNCSAVVPTLLESELFGHEKGAFTGADAAKIGKLQLAEAGTVFFDEIGDMSIELQAKLLRALQEREFERVGGTAVMPLRARVVAATNRNLDALVQAGTFREDLAYRLAVSRIVVPPLRDRRGDIPVLVDHLLGLIRGELHRPIESIETAALEVLAAYEWPGNVRELENVLTRAALLSRGPVLSQEAVERAMGRPEPASSAPEPATTLRQAERACVEAALLATGWNITHAAKRLDISPTTLRKKIRAYDLHS